MKRRDYKGIGENFGGDEHVHYFDCGGGFLSVNMSNKLYTLNMCSLLYANYISIKLLKY